MPKPTTLTGWWLRLVTKRANGKIGLLAALFNVSPRTIHKWGHGVIPNDEHRKVIRSVAGEKLLAREDCPEFLKPRKKKVATND